MTATDLPAWSEAFTVLDAVAALPLPAEARDWAWGGATGRGVKVAVVDSGIDADHPWLQQGPVTGVQGHATLALDPTADDGFTLTTDPHDDLVGHGTACAAIIRALAPECELHSVRVLGANLKGQGALLHAGIAWAVEQGMDVVNLSLSSKADRMFAPLHEIADEAYFASTVLVCAANNYPGPTYPSQFSSVVSVAARATDDPWSLAYNPRPPVEFAACGVELEVAWSDGGTTVATGNSFAAPHVAGLVALLRSKHPGLTPFQVKAVLQACAENAVPPADGVP